jgi:hypothetical protein
MLGQGKEFGGGTPEQFAAVSGRKLPARVTPVAHLPSTA